MWQHYSIRPASVSEFPRTKYALCYHFFSGQGPWGVSSDFGRAPSRELEQDLISRKPTKWRNSISEYIGVTVGLTWNEILNKKLLQCIIGEVIGLLVDVIRGASL